MYSLTAFGEMIVDRVRLDAYAEALRRQITPGCVVADIGAGTGILSLLACKLGARRVYAIELSDAAQLIRDTARDNGYADRIRVLRERSSELTLPERADVIVSDLRGVLPPFHRHLADIADARTRLLADGGRLVPAADRMFVGIVSVPELFEQRRAPWTNDVYGLSLGAALRFVDNSWQKYRAQADMLLSAPSEWARLDYHRVDDPRVRGAGTQRIEKDGVAHGLLVWFDAELCDGVGFSNRPGVPKAIYGQAFFPWPAPVSLRCDDCVDFELRADPSGDCCIWTWSSVVRRREAPEIAANRFRQSDFLATPLSADSLRKRAAGFRPELSLMGEIALRALERLRSGLDLQTLANELRTMHPEQFRSFDAALDFAGELSLRYSR
jgi:protein arginine N-methyltransferase 1